MQKKPNKPIRLIGLYAFLLVFMLLRWGIPPIRFDFFEIDPAAGIIGGIIGALLALIAVVRSGRLAKRGIFVEKVKKTLHVNTTTLIKRGITIIFIAFSVPLTVVYTLSKIKAGATDFKMSDAFWDLIFTFFLVWCSVAFVGYCFLEHHYSQKLYISFMSKPDE